MSWTKRQFVEQAFEEIGYAAYVFDLQPEQMQSALWRLDSMMAAWNAKGIRIGYPLPSSPEGGDIGQETGVPDAANEAVYLNLALRIAGMVGKGVSQETKMAAKMAYDTLLARAAMPREQQFPASLPLGAGNKTWRTDRPFVGEPIDPLLAGQDSAIDFE